jgi:hypothetical protein
MAATMLVFFWLAVQCSSKALGAAAARHRHRKAPALVLQPLHSTAV